MLSLDGRRLLLLRPQHLRARLRLDLRRLVAVAPRQLHFLIARAGIDDAGTAVQLADVRLVVGIRSVLSIGLFELLSERRNLPLALSVDSREARDLMRSALIGELIDPLRKGLLGRENLGICFRDVRSVVVERVSKPLILPPGFVRQDVLIARLPFVADLRDSSQPGAAGFPSAHAYFRTFLV